MLCRERILIPLLVKPSLSVAMIDTTAVRATAIFAATRLADPSGWYAS